MKGNKLLLIIIILFSIGLTPVVKGQSSVGVVTLNAITLPVVITNDTYLGSLALSGTGIFADPYILNFNITGDGSVSLVVLEDISVYFHIRDSILSGGIWGITFDNVTNGRVINNAIYLNDKGGVQLTDSDGNYVDGNVIGNNVDLGVALINSRLNVIQNNFIANNSGVAHPNLGLDQYSGGGGIFGDPSNDNGIINNTIYSNNLYGINFVDSINLNIVNNSIYFNDYGINLTAMEDTLIWNNEIYDNDIVGIYIDESSGIELEDNTMFNNPINVEVDGVAITISVTTSLITLPGSLTTIPTTVSGSGVASFGILAFMVPFIFIPIIRRKYT